MKRLIFTLMIVLSSLLASIESRAITDSEVSRIGAYIGLREAKENPTMAGEAVTVICGFISDTLFPPSQYDVNVKKLFINSCLKGYRYHITNH